MKRRWHNSLDDGSSGQGHQGAEAGARKRPHDRPLRPPFAPSTSVGEEGEQLLDCGKG